MGLLHHIIEDRGLRLILASQSPRRRSLMSDCGLQFECRSYDVEELYPSDLAAEDVAEYLARLKSDAYPEELSSKDILITADTVVVHEGSILGKPNGREGARKMLESLSGSEHIVVSGVVLRSRSRVVSFSATTKVSFSTLSSEQIEYYLEAYAPYDKAGSYGIQEWIGYIGVEHIEGSFYNVMGLPIQRLYSELSSFVDDPSSFVEK